VDTISPRTVQSSLPRRSMFFGPHRGDVVLLDPLAPILFRTSLAWHVLRPPTWRVLLPPSCRNHSPPALQTFDSVVKTP
jgi:hypothetical protein